MNLHLRIIFILIFLFTVNLLAAQEAVIITDGAMIYQKPDFDSAVIGYMRAGEKAQISSKPVGAFYKIRFKQGVLGYISDVDVNARGGANVKNSPKSLNNKNLRKSFLTKKYFGLLIGSAHFSEVYNKTGKDVAVGENLLFYGVKYTQPIKFLSGPFVFDVEAFYHSGAPQYYNFSGSQAKSGRILIADVEVLYSLFESRSRSFWFYLGGGPAVSYTAFIVETSGSQNDISDVQFGGIFTAGLGIQISSFAIKVEPKYFVFKTGYFGAFGSLQFNF